LDIIHNKNKEMNGRHGHHDMCWSRLLKTVKLPDNLTDIW